MSNADAEMKSKPEEPDLSVNPAASGDTRSDLPLYRTERIIASLTVAWVIILTTYMLFQDSELSYTSVYFLKIILSLSGAVMLATLPGFFDVSYNLSGFSVRAAGGAAAFVFIYTQSPNLPAIKALEQPGGGQEQTSSIDQVNTGLPSRSDGYPVLFALAISPASFAPMIHNYQYTEHDGSNPYFAGVFEQGHGPEISSTRPLQAFASTVVSYSRAIWNAVVETMRTAGLALQASLGRLVAAVGNLLGLPGASGPAQSINVYSEVLPSDLDPLAGALAQSRNGIDNTLDAAVLFVNEFAWSSLTSGLDLAVSVVDDLQPVLGFAEETTGEIAGTVFGLTDGTAAQLDRIAGFASHSTTAVLGDLNGVVHAPGTISRLNGLGDKGGLLGAMNNGVNNITASINEISPKVISTIDPDFAASAEKYGKTGIGRLGGNGSAFRPLNEQFGTLQMDEWPDVQLPDGVTDLPEAAEVLDKLKTATRARCLAGCDRQGTANGRVRGGINGLPGGGAMPRIGGANTPVSGNPGSPGVAVFGSSPGLPGLSAGSGPGPGGGGPVSGMNSAAGGLTSTINNTVSPLRNKLGGK